MRRGARAVAGGVATLAAAAGLLTALALESGADLARGRERLLAGDPAAAEAAFARARRWPGSWPDADAGRAVAAAAAGRETGAVVPLARLEALAPEALLLSALATQRLDAAAALAGIGRRAAHPLGPLYAAAVAFDRGDEPSARALAADGRVPLSSRGLGSRLRQALAARDRGATRLLFDRRGELVATVTPDGGLGAEPSAEALVDGVLERMPAIPGRGAARLAVDLDLSRLAEEALGGRRGSIVLVEPATGAVLAAVSDAHTVAAEGAAAFTQRREPASIAKVLTAAAALRAGVDVDAAIARMTCTGVERYGGQPLWCPWPAGPLAGLDHALALSCNVAFASVGARLGAERLREEYRRWGFDGEAGDLLGAAGRVHTPPRTPRQLADLSIGLELSDVTPVHAALLAAAVAGGGRMPGPTLLLGGCGGLGLARGPLPEPAGRPVVDVAVARRLRRAMEAVAAYGTGAGLAPPGFPIAMKTGTGAEHGKGYHANYVGMGPLPDPVVAFAVRVTNERTSPAVTTATREVTRRLLRGLADRRGRLLASAQP